MTVRQFMNKNAVSLPASATLLEAARKMKEKNIGSMIIEENLKVKGILTDRDIAFAVAAEGKNPSTTCVCDIMVHDPITVDVDADLDSALRIMNRANVRRLPVLENGKLCGVISSADIAGAMKEEINQFLALEESYTGARG
ncbi:MAG: CBS domain-containing protein [Nitrospiraceae bacterium]|nr:CBS domain-containing protein [Nitrospiraceae bacterium]